MPLKQLRDFIESEQSEKLSDDELINIIHTHESNPFYRSRSMLSFVGFAKYMLDKNNYAFENDPEFTEQPNSSGEKAGQTGLGNANRLNQIMTKNLSSTMSN